LRGRRKTTVSRLSLSGSVSSGTVRTEETEEGTLRDGQVDALQRLHVAVLLLEVLDFDGGCHYGSNPGARRIKTDDIAS
jgi:hypothetical protein